MFSYQVCTCDWYGFLLSVLLVLLLFLIFVLLLLLLLLWLLLLHSKRSFKVSGVTPATTCPPEGSQVLRLPPSGHLKAPMCYACYHLGT